MAAWVAPVGQTMPAPAASAPIPSKVNPFSNWLGVPGAGSVIVMPFSGPSELLVPVWVTVLGSPACTVSRSNVLPATMSIADGGIRYVSLAGGDVASLPSRPTLVFASSVMAIGSVRSRTLSRCSMLMPTPAVAPVGMSAPSMLANVQRIPVASAGSTPAGRVGWGGPAGLVGAVGLWWWTARLMIRAEADVRGGAGTFAGRCGCRTRSGGNPLCRCRPRRHTLNRPRRSGGRSVRLSCDRGQRTTTSVTPMAR